MKYLKSIATALVLMTAATGIAWAQHGHYHDHFRSRVYIGVGPFWDPWFYAPPPTYYYPPPVVYTSPPVYIEQAPSPAPAASSYWYYCPEAKRYYPYVKDCPGGWQQVAPTPPNSR